MTGITRKLLVAGLSLCCSGALASEYDVAAYVWPAYQPEPRWAELGIFADGKGEWQNVKEAVPKWDGHRQPLVPLWGYENEADPKVVEKKIDAAVQHGGFRRERTCESLTFVNSANGHVRQCVIAREALDGDRVRFYAKVSVDGFILVVR